MPRPPAKKSTTVRLYRHVFEIGEAIAPRLTGRFATRLWFTLPASPRTAVAPNGATTFTVTAQGATVRGSYWGDGPVVYLVHGWGGQGRQLASYVAPLVKRGYRVVSFDSPSHGSSDPGPSGRRSSTAVEFAEALEAVAARFGPASAVIAHSMGAISTVMTLKRGQLSARRLVLLAPLTSFSVQFRALRSALAIGPRTHRHVEELARQRVGVPMQDLDLDVLLADVEARPTLVVHDREDRQTSFAASQRLSATLPQALFIATEGLGHHRLLRDPQVIENVVEFVNGEHAQPSQNHRSATGRYAHGTGVAPEPSRCRIPTDGH